MENPKSEVISAHCRRISNHHSKCVLCDTLGMNGEPIHARIGSQHRWMLNETYSVTSKQAGDRRRGYMTQLPIGSCVSRDIYCHDCGVKYINSGSSQTECLLLVQ